ncbi:CPBP family intramembrane glutamic endopeptidase [Egbenema bharatensis]|uniref:CPBP family intramembrane glutamic endopeptidase n=1 Tax=Egbenema bharatensis TaxID=3463334 RepID=UPI003A83596C
MGAAFLSAANQGKNNWWRYGLGILLTAFFWIILGSIPLIIWGLYHPEAILTPSSTPITQVWQYAVVSLSFVFFLLGLFITVRKIHQRRFLTLIQANAAVSIKRILQGAGVWAVLMGLSYGIEAIFFPGHFVFTFNAAWFILVPIALVLTPIQSATEELFFRGYLLQGLGLLSRNRWILIGLTSIIFAVLHFGNPEVAASNSFIWIALHYFAFGAFFALTTLKDNTLELAIGSHIANNFFLATLISPSVSVLNTPALITHTVIADAQIDFFLFLLQATLFYLIVFHRKPHKNKTGRRQRLP